MGALESSYPEACLAFDHFAFRTFGVSARAVPECHRVAA